MTPGCTVAVRPATSMSRMAFSRSTDSTIPPSIAFAAPARPVPAPRVTTGMPRADAIRSVATTSSVDRARTSASGVPASVSIDWSRL